jgi:hypothetical protein
MNFIPTGAVTADLYLPAAKFLVAQDADSLVIQRRPVSAPVDLTENQQPFIQQQVGSDCHVISLPG